MIKICPRCNRRYVTEDNTVDIIHICNSQNSGLDFEDVPKMGDYEDYTGSGEVQNADMQGTQNKLFGTRADIEGEDTEELTRRGRRKSTFRTRQHLHFIKLEGGK